ncbi:hypothetical protein HNQ96_004645 [Aminobacter lissarensis]|uniref:Uncharacterized protein n=1 Tax=Aminobacter carboxidus TaxID=376165 RepID=A0A8E2BE66_9HYPH|nr:hypothetical protein [Aminobacter lissarensis]
MKGRRRSELTLGDLETFHSLFQRICVERSLAFNSAAAIRIRDTLYAVFNAGVRNERLLRECVRSRGRRV